MKQLRWSVALLLLALASCATNQTVTPPGHSDRYVPPATRLIEGPSVPPPANDIPESERRAWLNAQRPRVEYVPAQIQAEPPRVRYEREYDRCDDWGGWYLPLSLSLGYWGGSHGHDGWGWGLGWNSGWRRGCGW